MPLQAARLDTIAAELKKIALGAQPDKERLSEMIEYLGDASSTLKGTAVEPPEVEGMRRIRKALLLTHTSATHLNTILKHAMDIRLPGSFF